MAITKELKYIHIVTNYGSVKKKKKNKEGAKFGDMHRTISNTLLHEKSNMQRTYRIIPFI